MASILEFGFTIPLLIKGDQVLAGHARLEAAKHIGLSEVPIINARHLSESQARAYVIADNATAIIARGRLTPGSYCAIERGSSLNISASIATSRDAIARSRRYKPVGRLRQNP